VHAGVRQIAHASTRRFSARKNWAPLSERAPLPLVVRALPDGRLLEPIEVTAYLLAAEAVAARGNGAGRAVAVSISVAQRGQRVPSI
jgi:hypothetical protein